RATPAPALTHEARARRCDSRCDAARRRRSTGTDGELRTKASDAAARAQRRSARPRNADDLRQSVTFRVLRGRRWPWRLYGRLVAAQGSANQSDKVVGDGSRHYERAADIDERTEQELED